MSLVKKLAKEVPGMETPPKPGDRQKTKGASLVERLARGFEFEELDPEDQGLDPEFGGPEVYPMDLEKEREMRRLQDPLYDPDMDPEDLGENKPGLPRRKGPPGWVWDSSRVPKDWKRRQKPSLVQRLSTIACGGDDPGAVQEVVRSAQKKASLVQKLAADFLTRPMGLPKLAEVRFENMEAAQKAVSKIYEQTEKALDDLQTTGQDLQQNNLDLASQKVMDMAHSIRGIKETFESEFPHLMKFTSPEVKAPAEMPAEGVPSAPPAPEPQAQPPAASPPGSPPPAAPAPPVPAPMPASRKE